MTAPFHLGYEAGGRREYCLSFGETGFPRNIMLVPPLFDEMNRTRRMLVTTMRILATRGIRSILGDLPGCNESMTDISVLTLDSWRQAIKCAASECGATHVISLRGGTLIDDLPSLPLLRLAPVKGASILKTMLRTRIIADKEEGKISTIDGLLAEAVSGSLELSGYVLSGGMLETLERAVPAEHPNMIEVSLAEVNGSPLWLRAEPQEDDAMSAAFAARIDSWSASCGT